MTFNDMVASPSGWLNGTGTESAVVLSTRLRLARNLESVPFPPRARKDQLVAVMHRTSTALGHLGSLAGAEFFDMTNLGAVEKAFLMERHLISRDLQQGARVRGVVVGVGEELSVMVNEEDHFRVQAIESGFQLARAWEKISRLDDEMAHELDYAFRPDMGYLTACPTNVGTGMRASVLIHLPSLVLTKQAKKVLQGVNAVGLAVRGFYGEGTEVMGNFFQVSNQATLGRSEMEILESLERVTRQLIEYENRAREAMLKSARVQVEDKVWRAYGTLRYCRSISSQEVISLGSAVRFGLAMGLEGVCDTRTLNEIMVYAQPAHIQQMAGREMSPGERNVVRADYIRRRLDSTVSLN